MTSGWIIKQLLPGRFDFNLHVADIGHAVASLQMLVKRGKKIAGDQVVYMAGTGHGVDFSSDIFMPDFADEFPGEIVIDRDE